MGSVFGEVSITSFTYNPFETNTFVLVSGGESAIVDASPHREDEISELLRFVEDQGVRVKHLLLTHAHIDHIFGCARLARSLNLGWALHPADHDLLGHAQHQAALFGTQLTDPPEPTRSLQQGDEIVVGSARLEVRHTPGHSPGSVSFVDRENGYVLSGDVLFRGSIGRTDLWAGSYPQLIKSIRDELLSLPDETVVFSGHGPATTVGDERRSNPFLGD